MNYRSVADLNDRIVSSLSSLPRDLDLIVGIPRSGLLVANLMSLHLNRPMTDVDGLIAGRVLRTGSRYGGHHVDDLLRRKRNILVVDDSVCSGNQMTAVRERIKEALLPHRIRYGAVYVLPEAYETGLVDWFAEILPMPRIFEWNLMHHKGLLTNAFMAIDGVLCDSPRQTQNGGSQGYDAFLRSTPPSVLPTYPIGWLISSRPEKDRQPTEAWLARHGIGYQHLVMMGNGAAAAHGDDEIAGFKAGAYRNTDAQLFIESSPSQAPRIAVLSQKPVFCTATREMRYLDGATHRTQPFAAASVALQFAAGDEIRRLSRVLAHRLFTRARNLVAPDVDAELAK